MLIDVLAVFAAVFLASSMLSLGLELGRTAKPLRVEKRSARLALLRGLLLQLVLIPLLVGIVTHALHTKSDVAIALMFLVASPGGGVGPLLVKWGEGDVSLGVELALFLAKLTVFTAPFTAKWLLGVHALHIHEAPFLVELVLFQFVPVYAGKWIRRHRDALAERMVVPLKWTYVVAALSTLAAIVVDGRGRNAPALIGDRGWIAVLVVAAVAILLAFVLAGRKGETRRCFVIGANARDVAIALVMAGIAFPDRLVRAAVLGVWMVLLFVSALLAWALRGKQRPSSADSEVHSQMPGRTITGPHPGEHAT